MLLRFYSIIILILLYQTQSFASHSLEIKDALNALKIKDYDLAIKLADSIAQEQVGDSLGECYYIKAYSQKKKNDLGSAMQSYLMALKHFVNRKKIVDINADIGNLMTNLGLNEQSLVYFDEAIKNADKGNKSKYYAYYNRARSYKKLEEFDLAAESIIKAEELARESGDEEFLLRVYNISGLIYLESKDYNGAARMFDRLIKLNEYTETHIKKSGYIRNSYHAHRNMAYMNLLKNDTLTAIGFYEKAVTFSNSNLLSFRCWKDIGEVQLLLNNKKQARIALKKALSLVTDHELLGDVEDINVYKYLASSESGDLSLKYMTKGFELLSQFVEMKEEVNKLHLKNLGIMALNNHYQEVESNNQLSIWQWIAFSIFCATLILSLIGVAYWLIFKRKIKAKQQTIDLKLSKAINHLESQSIKAD